MRAAEGPSEVNPAALRVTGGRCYCVSAAKEETNFLTVVLSQETSDLAETSDHKMLASTGMASLWVVFDSSTGGRSGGSRSLKKHYRDHPDHHNQHGRQRGLTETLITRQAVYVCCQSIEVEWPEDESRWQLSHDIDKH